MGPACRDRAGACKVPIGEKWPLRRGANGSERRDERQVPNVGLFLPAGHATLGVMRIRSGVRVMAVGVALAGVSGALAACTFVPRMEPPPALPKAVVLSVEQGLPPGDESFEFGVEVDVDVDDEMIPKAYVTYDPVGALGTLYVVTYGSGSCPSVPSAFNSQGTLITGVYVEQMSADVLEGGELAEVCSADLGPTTSVVEIPEGYTVGTDLIIQDLSAVFGG